MNKKLMKEQLEKRQWDKFLDRREKEYVLKLKNQLKKLEYEIEMLQKEENRLKVEIGDIMASRRQVFGSKLMSNPIMQKYLE